MVITRSGEKALNESDRPYSKLYDEMLKVESNSQRLKRRQKESQPLKDADSSEDDYEIDPQEEDEDSDSVSEQGDTIEDTSNKGYLNGYCKYILIAFLIGIVILIAFVPPYPLSLKPSSDGSNHIWVSARKNMHDNLKPKYAPYVPSIGFRVLENALRDVLNRNDSIADDLRVPSVVLLVGTKADKNAVRCFASDIAKLIANAYKNTEGSIVEASHLNAKQISESFDSNFNNGRSRSIFLNGIEGLKGKDPSILHRYTDHGNAIFRDVVILLSAYGEENEVNVKVNTTAKEMDRIANTILEKAWISSMDENVINALLSRITPSVVVLMKNLDKNIIDCS